MNNDVILEVKDLSIEFETNNGTVKAIRGVDFSLSCGESLSIVGESGSGKSVTTRSIMGLLAKNGKVTNGTIMYDGKDLSKISDKEFQHIRGKDIAMIFQDPMTSLDPTMKIGKQIEEGLIKHTDFDKEKRYNRVIELLEQVGIDRPEIRYNQYPHQFSGGMRQRVVIAIALACNPKILICDEPTTALDVTIQAQIIDLIKEIQQKNNLAVIFITHDLGVVANISDRVAVMYAGKIVEIGTSDEVFYHSKHPYTWGLLASMPDLKTKGELYAIPGTPPNLIYPPKGDAFAQRSEYALEIDFIEEPPLFKVSDTHYAATWLLHPDAPEAKMPKLLSDRIEEELKEVANNE